MRSELSKDQQNVLSVAATRRHLEVTGPIANSLVSAGYITFGNPTTRGRECSVTAKGRRALYRYDRYLYHLTRAR